VTSPRSRLRHNRGIVTDTSASALPTLRDQLLDPTGGLVYHLRAARHRRRLWAPFHATVARWLGSWQPGRTQLVIVGPNAGYALPAGFLARFERVTALEPDPIARWLLARRPDASRLVFDRLDCLATPDGLARLAARFPDAAILFSNVLGQLDAPSASWAELLARHLPAHPWASYHDVISTTTPPTRDTPCTVTDDAPLDDVLAKFWRDGTLTVTDHATFRLGGAGPQGYAIWPITPRRWHLVEWVARPAGAD